MKILLRSSAVWIVLIVSLVTLIFAIRLSGPADLEGYAQHRNVGYVMDMMWQGNWLAQHDVQGRILSKPPLHTWSIAPFAALFGVDRLAMAFPSYLAVMALALVVFFAGKQRFGLLAGGLAALAVMMAPTMSKHIALVRSDALFSLFVAVAALSAYRAWETGRGWALFWVASGLATLTKGPLGLLLAASGLLAWFWERRVHPDGPRPSVDLWPGMAWFLVISLGWFVVAWWREGFDLIDKMIFDELLGQATGARKDSIPGENLPKPTGYLLLRFLPFSLFFFIALWRVFKRPSAVAAERRFERFLAVWVLSGLLVFSLAAHFRPDLLLPLWAACALLAGREMALAAQRYGEVRSLKVIAVVCVLLLASTWATYHKVFGKRAERSDHTAQVAEAAHAIRHMGIDPALLHHVGTPVTLQMHLGTYRRWLSEAELTGMLAHVTEPVWLAVDREPAWLSGLLMDKEVERVFTWPDSEDESAVLRIYRVTELPVVSGSGSE